MFVFTRSVIITAELGDGAKGNERGGGRAWKEKGSTSILQLSVGKHGADVRPS